jgi:hypothetical protein
MENSPVRKGVPQLPSKRMFFVALRCSKEFGTEVPDLGTVSYTADFAEIRACQYDHDHPKEAQLFPVSRIVQFIIMIERNCSRG